MSYLATRRQLKLAHLAQVQLQAVPLQANQVLVNLALQNQLQVFQALANQALQLHHPLVLLNKHLVQNDQNKLFWSFFCLQRLLKSVSVLNYQLVTHFR